MIGHVCTLRVASRDPPGETITLLILESALKVAISVYSLTAQTVTFEAVERELLQAETSKEPSGENDIA